MLLRDRTYTNSDPYRMHVCNICGLFADANRLTSKYACVGCNTSSEISEVELPYAMKLLCEELAAFSIAVRISVKPKEEKPKK